MAGVGSPLAVTLVVILFLGNAAGQQMVSLRLNIVPLSASPPSCIGGDVGLTDYSVEVQYRLISPQNPPVSEWRFVSEIDPSVGFDGTLSFTTDGSSEDGVQFRLLQLQHGGGKCNCWTVLEASAAINGGPNNTLSMCVRASSRSNIYTFCGGTASKARGFISEVQNHGNKTDECPDNSSIALISSKGPPLPRNCPSTSTM